MCLGRNENGVASLVEFTQNRGRFGQGYEPTHADMRRIALEKRERSTGQLQELQVGRIPLCHIDESFVGAGWICKGWVVVINEETPQANQLRCGRVLQSSNWGIGESSNNPRFPQQTQCNSLVTTILLGLGLRVCSLFGHAFRYHEIINTQSFFI